MSGRFMRSWLRRSSTRSARPRSHGMGGWGFRGIPQRIDSTLARLGRTRDEPRAEARSNGLAPCTSPRMRIDSASISRRIDPPRPRRARSRGSPRDSACATEGSASASGVDSEKRAFSPSRAGAMGHARAATRPIAAKVASLGRSRSMDLPPASSNRGASSRPASRSGSSIASSVRMIRRSAMTRAGRATRKDRQAIRGRGPSPRAATTHSSATVDPVTLSDSMQHRP